MAYLALFSFSFRLLFLVADTQLYKRLCPSVRWSVGWLVGWSVGRSVTLELKSGKMRISAPAHPSATDGRVSGLVLWFSVQSSKKIGNNWRQTLCKNWPMLTTFYKSWGRSFLMSKCHFFQNVIMLLCYPVIMSLCDHVIESWSHLVIKSFSHCISYYLGYTDS